jgi:DNA-binding response OmpR family regulator
LVTTTAEILIVEDDEVIMGTLAYNLSRNGFGVSQATNGADALRLARKSRPNLILLDVMLPGESGIEVCESIRERDQGVVIVMITAKDAEEDKVRGFEAGADDYVTKPFGMKELVARINANLKRSETGSKGKIIETGDLELDTKNFTTHAARDFPPRVVRLSLSAGNQPSRSYLINREGED